MDNGWQFTLGIIILLIGIIGLLAIFVYEAILYPMLVGLLLILALGACVCGACFMVYGVGF